MAMIAGPLFARAETKLIVGMSFSFWYTFAEVRHLGTPAGKLYVFGSAEGRLKLETTLECDPSPGLYADGCCAGHRAGLLPHWPLMR
jgi:hypothetical protein